MKETPYKTAGRDRYRGTQMGANTARLSLICIFLSQQIISSEIEPEGRSLSPKERRVASLIFSAFSLRYGMQIEDLARLKVSVSPSPVGLGDEVMIRCPQLSISYDRATGMPRSISPKAKTLVESKDGENIRKAATPSVEQARIFLIKSKAFEHLGFTGDSIFQVDIGALTACNEFFQLNRTSQGFSYDDELVVVNILRCDDQAFGYTIDGLSSSINYSMESPAIDSSKIMPENLFAPNDAVRSIDWVIKKLGDDGIDLTAYKDQAGLRGLRFCHANNFFSQNGEREIGYDRTREVSLCRRFFYSTEGNAWNFNITIYLNAFSGLPHAGFMTQTQKKTR